MKAAIIVDDYKLPVFERRLSEAGYWYEKEPGVIEGTLSLTIETDDAIEVLEKVVRAANIEAIARGGAGVDHHS